MVLDVNRFGLKGALLSWPQSIQNVSFVTASSKTLVEAMVERIMEDRKELTSDNKALIRKSKSVTYWHDQKYVATVIERYREQMATEEMEQKRSYLNTKFAWTERDVQK